VQWCADGDFLYHFCVLYFQRAACSTFQTCILNSQQGHTTCGSMVDIQSAAAEIRRGIKKDRKKLQGKNIMSASATQGGHKEGCIISTHRLFSHIRHEAPVCIPSNIWFPGRPYSASQTASRSVQPFSHTSWKGVASYNVSPLFPLKIAPGPPSNTWFLGPTRVHSPNGISNGSDMFCRAHDHDRQTDRLL